MDTNVFSLAGNYKYEHPYFKKLDSRFNLQIFRRESLLPNKPEFYLRAHISGEFKYISSLYSKKERINGQRLDVFKFDFQGIYYLIYFISEDEVKIIERGHKMVENDKIPLYNNRNLSRVNATVRKRPKPGQPFFDDDIPDWLR